MASRSKKKTTMAKLSRESRLRERRVEKAARKEARKQAAANDPAPTEDALTPDADESADAVPGQPDVEPVLGTSTDV